MIYFALAVADPTDEVLPHTLFNIGSLPVTNQMLMAVVVAVLMLLIFPALFSRKYAEGDVVAPHGSTNFFESILEFLRVEVFRPALKEHTDRFLPFLWTLFFFILFGNLLGQLPIAEIVTLITHKESHLGGTATGYMTLTGGLAICAFVVIHLGGMMQIARSLINGTYGHHGHHEEHSSNGSAGHEAAIDLQHARSEGLSADVPNNFKAIGNPTKHYADDEHHSHHHDQPDDGHLHGGGESHGKGMNPAAAILLSVPLYFWNFAPHPFKPAAEASPFGKFFGWTIDVLMWAFLLILELIGAVIKPFALMIRLFANMIGGHLVLGSLVLLIPLSAGFLHQMGIGAPVTILSLLIRVLELFVAFLQAYIFTFLTTLFIASAVAPEH